MYIIFFLIAIILLFTFIFYYKHRASVRKISALPLYEKNQKLNYILNPFGFEYNLAQDIFTSHLDAWQKDYGYQYLFDLSAPHFNMVIDCEPVYFDYDGCTWLLEFWKGQYGINIGAEIGIYKADRLLEKEELSAAHFHAVSENELPVFGIKLYNKNSLLYSIHRRHWWLTGFVMGKYTEPEDLHAEIHIHFPHCQMSLAFLESIRKLGYHENIFSDSPTSVTIFYKYPVTEQPRNLQKFSASFAQWKNRIFLKLYLWSTRSFDRTIDKLLYLYEFLPVAFRHMVHIQRHKKGRS